MKQLNVKLYYDYKSPYTHLAKEELYRIEDEYEFRMQWLPWNFPIEPSYGAAGSRTPSQQNRVKYMYMDVRRVAAERGLVIRR